MSQFRLAHLGLVAALLGLNLALGSGAAYGEALRPEVGKPLQAAQEDIKKGKYKDALAKIHDADAAGGKTPYELFVIAQLQASAAQGAGDSELAAKAYEAMLASGRLPAGEQGKVVQAMSYMYYQSKDYPKAIAALTRYFSEGGTDPSARALLTESYYLSGDFTRVAKDLEGQIQADEKAGRAPTEDQLAMLANCASRQNDKALYAYTLEKRAVFYPKKDVWTELLRLLQGKSGFADSRLGLDLSRLQFATGTVTTTDDYMNMAELALQAGYPAEAAKVVDAAFKSGAFGNGSQAERQKRLKNMATKNAADDVKSLPQLVNEMTKAKEGTGLVNIGYDYVTIGQFDKGIALMEQGIEKGDLKHPEDAKLHLGLAYLQAGQKAKALQTLKSVQGADGTAEIAHYWTILINHPVN